MYSFVERKTFQTAVSFKSFGLFVPLTISLGSPLRHTVMWDANCSLFITALFSKDPLILNNLSPDVSCVAAEINQNWDRQMLLGPIVLS